MTERNSGTILDGKYEILDRLAAGGMGEIWRARHVHLQELRVIKILRADRATDPHALQRFAQEAREKLATTARVTPTPARATEPPPAVSTPALRRPDLSKFNAASFTARRNSRSALRKPCSASRIAARRSSRSP